MATRPSAPVSPPTRTGVGRVSLVGAGPGDPDLMTVRGAQRLAAADVVLYDALVSPAMRALAPAARWFCVGKRAGRPSMSQELLNRLLIREARRGLAVVRLKCGDPFVLGRGGEEALALVRAGIPFEVVPGLSSAIAAPALMGIPVTHRGCASGVLVLAGHDEASYAPVLRGLPPGRVTVVILMGMAKRSALADFLLGQGWPRHTPAAMLVGAATPQAWRWTGPLVELGQQVVPEASAGAPGVLVIGDVVAMAAELAPSGLALWMFEQRARTSFAVEAGSITARRPRT